MKIVKYLLLVSVSINIYANNILNLPELTERDGLMYQKFSNVPFTGKGKMTQNLHSENCEIMVVDVVDGKMPMKFPIKMEIWNCNGQLTMKGIANADKSSYQEKWDNQGKKILDMKYSKERKPDNGWELKNINLKDVKVFYKNGQVTKKIEINTN